MQAPLFPEAGQLQLTAAGPFSYRHNLDYLRRSPDECLYHITDDGIIYKALSLTERPALLEIRDGTDSGGPGLSVRVGLPAQAAAAPPGEKDLQLLKEEAARYVMEWFDLERDLMPFYAMAEADPLLQSPVLRFRGLRLMGIPDLFEALCWGIIGQQINLAFAYTLKKRFVERYGQKLNTGGMTLWTFPEPQDIAKLEVPDLTPLQLTSRKAEYLIGIARLLAEGRLSKAILQAEPGLQHMERRLVSIRGIGPWTAHYVLMRCLRIPSAFPIDDVGLHNAIRFVTGADAKPAKAEIERLAAGWKDWESYATFYLWRVL